MRLETETRCSECGVGCMNLIRFARGGPLCRACLVQALRVIDVALASPDRTQPVSLIDPRDPAFFTDQEAKS